MSADDNLLLQRGHTCIDAFALRTSVCSMSFLSSRINSSCTDATKKVPPFIGIEFLRRRRALLPESGCD